MGWVPSASADALHNDQEMDLGDGWWLSAIERTDGQWGWGVYDRWLHDDATLVGSGIAPTEVAAKAAAQASAIGSNRVAP